MNGMTGKAAATAPPDIALDNIEAFDAERSQAIVRLLVAVAVTMYILVRWLWPMGGEPISRDAALTLVAYYVIAFMAVAAALAIHIHRRPGHLRLRRAFSMSLDYGSIAFTMILGGEQMLPLFAIILWVTIGNGLRFGRSYLLISSVMAQMTIAAVTLLTPYWWDHPNLVITCSLSALVIPLYAFSLLRKMEEARLAALEANTAKSRFLAQASHDLRQPVHAIGLFIASLRQTSLNQAQRVIVDRIDRSLQGVARLFRSLLDISTIDSGAVSPRLERVMIGEILTELAQQNAESAAWAGCNLRFVPSKRQVIADRALLMTMIQNLISNALKYAPGRSILIGARRRGETLSILVCDQGPGIALEHIPHLCEEFYQVRKLGDPDTQGVGLGLAIVDRLARLMGLRIEISSFVGRGTTAAISGLPLLKGDEATLPFAQARDLNRPLQGMRVLLCEDDIDVLEATADLLRSWGCAVECLSGIPTSRIDCDLIIADFDVGGGTIGTDCIEAVHRFAGRVIPAIVMTGHDERHVTERIGDANIPILKKPIRPAELRSMIATMQLRMRKAV
jgi:signal transduction histidine kinase/CheY-like chemotaxis protein